MIGRWHGHEIDLNGLRQRYSVSMAGASLGNLIALGDQLGLASRALRTEVAGLDQVSLPAILHWDLDHFVVLKSISRRHAVIHDPARGMRRLSLEELRKHYTGIALELTPASDFTKAKATAPIGLTSLWSHISGFWRAAAQLLTLSVALQIVTLLAPFQMQLVIDQALSNGDGNLLAVIALAFGALIVIQAILDALRNWTTQIVGFLFSYQMKGNLVRHLTRLSSGFFEKRHMGDILSRLGSSGEIQNFLTQGVIAVVIDSLMAVVAGIVLFVYSPVLALVVVASVVLALAIRMGFYPIMRARLEEQLVSSAKEQTYLMETVRAFMTIRLMGHEAKREGVWRNLFGRVVNASLASARLQVASDMCQQLVLGLQSVIVIYIGARMILVGEGFSVGMLVAFLSYRQLFSQSAAEIINQYLKFRFLRLHLDRLGDIVAAAPERTSGDAGDILGSGQIELRDVSFRYGETDPFVLRNINVTVSPGDFLAITGPSGCGKSTLLKIMLGLYKPTSGAVFIEGLPATPERWRAWRRHLGVVAQDDRLLSGSIADNIAFFDTELNMDAVRRAAELAEVHEDISKMPMQYRSLIGDMGSSLSGGQRQRVLLARALYRNPSILFLDEGTANLDEKTEICIASRIDALPITRIVVAHRPALVQRANRIATMSSGRLSVDKK